MNCKETINSAKHYHQKIHLIRKPILNYTLSRVFNFSDAQDIVQNTLIILAKKANEFDPNKSFYGWGFAVCNFQIKRYLTDRSRNPEECVDEFDFEVANKGCSRGKFEPLEVNASDSPFDCLNKKESSKILSMKIKLIKNNLSPKQKMIFKYFLKGFPRNKIRDLMNMKTIAFNTTYRRIIENAQKILQEKYETNSLYKLSN